MAIVGKEDPSAYGILKHLRIYSSPGKSDLDWERVGAMPSHLGSNHITKTLILALRGGSKGSRKFKVIFGCIES